MKLVKVEPKQPIQLAEVSDEVVQFLNTRLGESVFIGELVPSEGYLVAVPPDVEDGQSVDAYKLDDEDIKLLQKGIPDDKAFRLHVKYFCNLGAFCNNEGALRVDIPEGELVLEGENYLTEENKYLPDGEVHPLYKEFNEDTMKVLRFGEDECFLEEGTSYIGVELLLETGENRLIDVPEGVLAYFARNLKAVKN